MPDFIDPQFLKDKISGIILFFTILIVTFIIGRIVQVLLTRFFKKSADIIHVDLSKYNLVKHLVVGIIYILGIALAIYSIPTLRTLSLSIFAGAGIIAAVIGFASQAAFSNIISGIFIVIFKPFRVDDRIQVGTEHSGVVEDITLRHTIIRNFENKRIVIPNALISEQTVINFTIVDEKICRIIDIGISYSSDIKKAKQIIQEEALKHPEFIDNRNEEQKTKEEHPVMVKVMGFGESSVNLRAWIWTKDPFAAFHLGSDLYESIKDRFDHEGIIIPFPHRTLIIADKKPV